MTYAQLQEHAGSDEALALISAAAELISSDGTERGPTAYAGQRRRALELYGRTYYGWLTGSFSSPPTCDRFSVYEDQAAELRALAQEIRAHQAAGC